MNLNISRVRSERALGIGCSAYRHKGLLRGWESFRVTFYVRLRRRCPSSKIQAHERRQRRRESWRYSSLSPTKSSLFASGDPVTISSFSRLNKTWSRSHQGFLIRFTMKDAPALLARRAQSGGPFRFYNGLRRA